MRSILFLAVLLSATPAMAQCVAPTAPAPLDGATAGEEQLRIAMAQAREFIAQSDVYQACVTAEVEATDLSHTTLKAVEAAANNRIAANQALKERVGATANAAMQSYKLAHPQ